MAGYRVSWSRAFRILNDNHTARLTAAASARTSAILAAGVQNSYDGTGATVAAMQAAIAAADAAYMAAVQASILQWRNDQAVVAAARANIDGYGAWVDQNGPLNAATAAGMNPAWLDVLPA